MNSTGTVVLSASYWGGSAGDSAADVATDLAGNVYITGDTQSPDFPVKPAAIRPGFDLGATLQNPDIFVSKFDASGTLSLIHI